jgi:3-isopropylmalate/(R)-2-methylmalate dehydratase large subunit
MTEPAAISKRPASAPADATASTTQTRDAARRATDRTAGRTFAEKLLLRASGRDPERDRLVPGEIVEAAPDVALSHDNTAAIAGIWSKLGQDRVAIAERIAITLDHAAPAPTPKHAKNHQDIRRFVREQGIAHFFEVGRGICHQVLSEEAIVLPGHLVLGADSHTPHFGWMGAMGVGIGRSEMAALWALGTLWLRVPETIEIRLEGKLSPWVSAKDLALHILGTFGADGGIYRSVELRGSAVARMGLAERAVLANMMAEFGVKSSFVDPDDAVFSYLAERLARRTRMAPEAAQERVRAGAIASDPDALYEARHVLDVGALEPQVACPHAVDRTVPVSEVETVHVDQAFLGTCTNGRLEDLEAACSVLRGQHVAAGTRLLVIPASSEVLAEAVRRGLVGELLAAGAVIGPPGCGPCMGNHLGVMAPGEVCISSANRNFQGRMGTKESEIYLASPAVVAASAVAGHIAHPANVAAGG